MDDPLAWSRADREAALAAIAPWYDLDFGSIDGDIALYRELAAEYGLTARVLELGAGSGRVAAALGRDGHRVTAVDDSPSMLAAGAERMQSAGVEVVQTDMRHLRLDGRQGRFDLAIIALSTFQHLLARADQLAALAAAAWHLSDEGALMIDWSAPRGDDVDEAPQPLTLEWVRRDRSGRTVTKTASQEPAHADPTAAGEGAGPIAWLTYLYDAIEDDGALRRWLARFPLRVGLGAAEMQGLLAAAGLEAVAWYGDYDLSPPGAGDRLIVVARRGTGQ